MVDVNAYGTMSHVFHMHGNGFSYQGFNQYAMSLNDGEGKTLYMSAEGMFAAFILRLNEN